MRKKRKSSMRRANTILESMRSLYSQQIRYEYVLVLGTFGYFDREKVWVCTCHIPLRWQKNVWSCGGYVMTESVFDKGLHVSLRLSLPTCNKWECNSWHVRRVGSVFGNSQRGAQHLLPPFPAKPFYCNSLYLVSRYLNKGPKSLFSRE